MGQRNNDVRTPSVQSPNRAQPGGPTHGERDNAFEVQRGETLKTGQGGGTGKTGGGLSNQGHVGQGQNRNHGKN